MHLLTQTRPAHPLRRNARLLLLAALALAAGSAEAQEPGFFVGVQAGASLLKGSDAEVSSGGTSTNVGRVKFGEGPLGGLTAGYNFANGLRPELEVNYRRNSFGGLGGGDIRAGTATANLYYNFVRNGYYFYLGGGGGYASLRGHFNQGGADTDYRSLYQAGTGFGFAATPSLTVGIDYRFQGAFERADFSRDINGTPGSTSLRYRGSLVSLALRFDLGRLFGGSSTAAGEAREPVRIVPVGS